jgi:uncharacterized protein YlxP (DUF503 family)
LRAEVRFLREKAGDKQGQVESLLKERRAALRKLVEILVSQYQVGTVDFNRVAHAESRLADAELEPVKSKDERIGVCQRQVELCRDVLKIVTARFDAGTVSQADLLDATAERLKMEIRLLQEKAGDKQGQVESLLKERRAAVRKLVEILVSQYQVGTVDFNRVAYAMDRLADAELESAKNKEERIAACQKQIELRLDVEKSCRARIDAGSASEADFLDAKAERLTAEIRLLREKVADKPTANSSP